MGLTFPQCLCIIYKLQKDMVTLIHGLSHLYNSKKLSLIDQIKFRQEIWITVSSPFWRIKIHKYITILLIYYLNKCIIMPFQYSVLFLNPIHSDLKIIITSLSNMSSSLSSLFMFCIGMEIFKATSVTNDPLPIFSSENSVRPAILYIIWI